MLIRYVASHARAHLKSAVLIFIFFVLFTHHTTSIDTVITHQSKDKPLTKDTLTNSTSATQNESMISNQSNRHMYDNDDNGNGNDYPVDSVTSNHLPLDNGNIKGDTGGADGQNTETILLRDTQSSIDGEEERMDILESQRNQDTTGEDIGDNGGSHDDEIGNHGDNFGNHGDDIGNHSDDVGDHSDSGNDNKDNDGLISDKNSFSDQDDDQDGGNHGNDTSNSIDNGHTMEDHGHTVEDNGDTVVDNSGIMDEYEGAVEDHGDIVDDDGIEGNNDDTVGVTDQDIERVQEASDIKKSLSNDSDTHQIPNDDQIRLMNTTDQLSLSEIEAITMTTHEEGVGLESDEGTQENNDDDIVTFEEFKNKMNQEGVSTKPSQTVASVPARQSYHSYHNYALTECGAAVLESNKEAKNAGSILLENKDLYMLNPCSAKIWFVIELCELVSVRILEISCFELFSSIPETIAVYTSDSYPDPVWENLGIFTLTDERGTQKFPLEESVYTKYIKFEMLTHYGTEHYCPISTIKVLGSTMIEEYEYTESQRDGGTNVGGGNKGEQQYDKIISNDNGKTQPQELPESHNEGNPIKAATDAILKFVGQAVNGFMIPLDEEYDEILDSNNNEQQQLLTTPSTHVTSSLNPTNNVLTEEDDQNSQNISESDHQPIVATEVVNSLLITPEITETEETRIEPDQLMTSNQDNLISTTRSSTIAIDPLGPTDTTLILSTRGTSSSDSTTREVPETTRNGVPNTVEIESSLVTTNMLTTVVDETRTSDSSTVTSDDDSSTTLSGEERNLSTLAHQPTPTLKPGREYNAETSEMLLQHSSFDTDGLVTSDRNNGIVDNTVNTIVPTSTTHSAEVVTDKDTSENNTFVDSTGTNTTLPQSEAIDNNVTNLITASVNTTGSDVINSDTTTNTTSTLPSDQQRHATLDDSSNNNNNDNGGIIDSPTSATSGSSAGTTTREKSVFVRLSNRINVLEVNMTLFDTYLDQISQSLKKNKNRTEDMQKSLERRISILNDTIQYIKEKVNINASLFDTVLLSVTELNQLYLSQQEDWTNFINYVSSYFLVIIFLQFLTIISCCLLHRLRSNQFKQLERSLKLTEARLHDINIALGNNTTTLPISHHHSNGTINKSDNNTVLSSANHKQQQDKNSQPVTITGSQHRRHHSFSNTVHSSASSPDLMLSANDEQKWKKVEHKKHKKSTCKKSEY